MKDKNVMLTIRFPKNAFQSIMLTTHFSRKTGLGTFFHQIKSGHFINVHF